MEEKRFINSEELPPEIKMRGQKSQNTDLAQARLLHQLLSWIRKKESREDVEKKYMDMRSLGSSFLQLKCWAEEMKTMDISDKIKGKPKQQGQYLLWFEPAERDCIQSSLFPNKKRWGCHSEAVIAVFRHRVGLSQLLTTFPMWSPQFTGNMRAVLKSCPTIGCGGADPSRKLDLAWSQV